MENPLCETVYKGTRIKALVGDITRIKADAVVNPANSLMVMGGGVAGVLKRIGGRIIEDEALKFAPVPVGKAIVTSAGRLRAKFVIHAPTMEKPAMKIKSYNAYKAVYAALTKAFDLSLKSIVFPGMGTGVGGLDPREAADAMIKAIKEFLDMLPGSVEEIIIVDVNPDIPRSICKSIKKYMVRQD